MKIPCVLSCGLGTNSTALLCGLKQLSMPWPDLILFADTGGEHPETYDYCNVLNEWLETNGGPAITTVRWRSKIYETLEQQCNVTGMLPSPAYGGRSCSIRWKQDAMHVFMKSWNPAIETWQAGNRVRKMVGYHWGERKSRAGVGILEDSSYTYSFPLIEWGWDHGECCEAIIKEGLPLPVKSSCFYCPAKTKKEVFHLYRTHPDLYERAVAMEENSDARKDLEGRSGGAKGLGRHWSWQEVIHGKPDQLKLWDDPAPIPCMCHDGESSIPDVVEIDTGTLDVERLKKMLQLRLAMEENAEARTEVKP